MSVDDCIPDCPWVTAGAVAAPPMGGNNQFVFREAIVPTAGAARYLVWEGADFTGTPSTFPSGLFTVSCLLPPGAAINEGYVQFVENVGN